MDYVSSISISSSNRSDGGQLRRPSRSTTFYPRSPSTSPPQLRPERPFGLHNRRLQLRNVGFRAVQLPGRKISDQIAAYRSTSWGSERESDKENNSLRSSSPGGDSLEGRSSWKRLNVLQESNKSVRRNLRRSTRPSVTTLFQRSPQDDTNTQSFTSPPSKSSRRLGSPLLYEDPEGSDRPTSSKSTDHRPNIHGSPTLQASPIIQKKKRDQGRQKASYETIKYIEHLETQLENQMDRARTPSTKPQIAKLRSMNAEIKSLRHDLAEWKSKFDARVAEEIGSWVENDAALRGRIRALESQVEADQCKIRELEYENETQATKLRNAEALSFTNRDLERRIDVLTELLAQSPSRMDSTRSPHREFPAWSPGRNGTKLPRPRSMVPCIPLSPGGQDVYQQLTLPHATTTQSTSTPQSVEVEDADCKNENMQESLFDQPMARVSSETTTKSSSGSSALALSVPKSQRSSMTSQSSFASAWSVPFPFSPENQAKIHSRHRKMRRFPSGSCTLKPLILPTATVGVADHAHAAPGHVPRNTVPDTQSSLDLTTAFLDEEMYVNSSETPAHLSWAQNESLNALEGRSQYYESFDEAIYHQESGEFNLPLDQIRGLGLDLDDGVLNTTHNYGTIADEIDTSFLEGSPEVHISDSLQENLPVDDPQGLSAVYQPAQGYCTKTPTKGQLNAHRTLFEGSQLTPNFSSTALTPPALRCTPTAKAVPVHAVGIISKYSDYFKELQQRPFDLVRRIVQNAWHSDWRRFGKLSWWVLGLFLGPKFRDKRFGRRCAPDADNHRYSVGARTLKPALDLENERLVGHGLAHPRPRKALLDDCMETNHAADTNPNGKSNDGSLEIPSRPSSLRRSLYLWAKFSLALIIAVGIAIKDGPARLMEDSRYQRPRDGPGNQPLTRPCTPASSQVLSPCDGKYKDDSDVRRSPTTNVNCAGSLGWVPSLTLDSLLNVI